jgi:hypothetical protein
MGKPEHLGFPINRISMDMIAIRPWTTNVIIFWTVWISSNNGYITQHFPIVLKKHGLRHIRSHELRHSCSSLLLANGVSLKDIQEWLGHSHYSTTANINAHLDYSLKVSSAQVMSNTLQIPIIKKVPESSQGQIQEPVIC